MTSRNQQSKPGNPGALKRLFNFGNNTPVEKPKTQAKAAVVSFVDGVDHINIWAQADTELGRLLSHFPRTRFIHPYFGPFNSMEGFWYYIKSVEQDDKLRRLWGSAAKNYGRTLTDRWVENFYDIIIAANFHKIAQHDDIKEMLIESTLPFDMYYRHGPGRTLIRPDGSRPLVEGFEKIRRLMKAGETIEEPDYSQLAKKR